MPDTVAVKMRVPPVTRPAELSLTGRRRRCSLPRPVQRADRARAAHVTAATMAMSHFFILVALLSPLAVRIDLPSAPRREDACRCRICPPSPGGPPAPSVYGGMSNRRRQTRRYPGTRPPVRGARHHGDTAGCHGGPEHGPSRPPERPPPAAMTCRAGPWRAAERPDPPSPSPSRFRPRHRSLGPDPARFEFSDSRWPRRDPGLACVGASVSPRNAWTRHYRCLSTRPSLTDSNRSRWTRIDSMRSAALPRRDGAYAYRGALR